jgi:hypothetical protein
VVRFRQHTAAALAAVVFLHGPGAGGHAQAADRTGLPLATPAAADGVRLRGRWFEEPVRRAVQGAVRGLEAPSCNAVLADFRDGSGRALASRLRALDLSAQAYARLVLFYDGSNDAPCLRPRVYAFTSPGSRVVRACPALGALAVSRPDEAEAVVIHEVLHTLGLDQDLPSSADVTAAVERRCAPSLARR